MKQAYKGRFELLLEKIKKWWTITPERDLTASIGWTPKLGGTVRSRVDDREPWGYASCPNFEDAETYGLRLIEVQKAIRIKMEKVPDNSNCYHGA